MHTVIKRKIGVMHRKNVVYRLQCSSDKFYMVQITQVLKRRIAEHKSDVNVKLQACALAKHINETNHVPKYNEVVILDYEPSTLRRNLVEMCYIAEQTDS